MAVAGWGLDMSNRWKQWAGGHASRTWILATTLAVTSIVVTSSATSAGAESPSASDVTRAAASRAAFGFRSDRGYVKALFDRDTGTILSRHGFPVTKAEAADLLERSTFAGQLDRRTLPFVRRLPAYGGEWIDQRHGGQLVVALTRVTQQTKAAVRSRMPKEGSRGVRFARVESSAAELTQALERSETAWSNLDTGFRPQAVAIHYRLNRITFMVLETQLEMARSYDAVLERQLGVDVGFAVEGKIDDLVCNARNNCYAPFQTGIKIYWPDPGASRVCGMAFHVVYPSDSSSPKHQTFLTAGHCAYGSTWVGPWHHSSAYRTDYGKIGDRVASMYNDTDKRDVALIKIQDWSPNKTTRIFGELNWGAAELTSHGSPIENEELCTSLSVTGQDLAGNAWYCGRVGSTSQWWISDTANPNLKVYGAALDFPGSGCTIYDPDPEKRCPPNYGDSGSPVFREQRVCGQICTYPRTPIGIVNAGRRDTPEREENHALYFARLSYVFGNDGWPYLEVYRGPQGAP